MGLLSIAGDTMEPPLRYIVTSNRTLLYLWMQLVMIFKSHD